MLISSWRILTWPKTSLWRPNTRVDLAIDFRPSIYTASMDQAAISNATKKKAKNVTVISTSNTPTWTKKLLVNWTSFAVKFQASLAAITASVSVDQTKFVIEVICIRPKFPPGKMSTWLFGSIPLPTLSTLVTLGVLKMEAFQWDNKKLLWEKWLCLWSRPNCKWNWSEKMS